MKIGFWLKQNPQWPVFSVLLILNYFPTFRWMIWRYEEVNSFSTHGYLIPFVSGWLVWSLSKGFIPNSSRGAHWGIPLMLSALFLHLSAGFFDISSISGLSMLLLIAGFLLLQLGFQGLKRFWFPVAFLFFMIPLPDFIISSLNFKLKFLASDMAAWLLDITGLPAVRSGSFMLFSGERLAIGDVCSGLRSLISLVALGVLYAWLIREKGMRFVFAALITIIPAAVFGNGLRICLVCYIAHWFGQTTVFTPIIGSADLHLMTGMVIFLGAFSMLYGVIRLVEVVFPEKKEISI